MGGGPMKTRVYLDNNVWDFLFARGIDLAEALPREEFTILLPREIEWETRAIPSHKADLKAFVAATIERCDIRSDVFFGYQNSEIPAGEQRFGGFGVGRYASIKEAAFMREQRLAMGAAKRSTMLYPNEADISLGARSFEAVVVSADNKRDPIRAASEQGGCVVFLREFEGSGMTLRDFIGAMPEFG